MTTTKLEDLLEFPCEFSIKVMGLNVTELISEVTTIVSLYATGFDPQRNIATKLSSKGNYLSLTVTIMAESKEQLDKIYLDLNRHPLVKITL